MSYKLNFKKMNTSDIFYEMNEICIKLMMLNGTLIDNVFSKLQMIFGLK